MMHRNTILLLCFMINSHCYCIEKLKEVEIFWSSDKNEKILLDWEVKTFFNWEENQGSYVPHYRHDINIPPLLKFEIPMDATMKMGDSLPKRRNDLLVDGKLLKVYSMLGHKIVALHRIASEEKKEAKLNIVLNNKSEKKRFYHEKCNENIFKSVKITFADLNDQTIYISCVKTERSLQFDLYSTFSSMELVSNIEEVKVTRKSDEHIRINLLTSKLDDWEHENKLAIASFVNDQLPLGDVILSVANFSNSGMSLNNHDSNVNKVQSKNNTLNFYNISLGMGVSTYGMFLNPILKIYSDQYNYQLKLFAPAKIVFDNDDETSYYYLSNYFMKSMNDNNLEYALGVAADYGRVQSDIESRYFLTIGPAFGVKFANDIFLLTNIDLTASSISKFFTKIIFNESDPVISYFVTYDKMKVDEILFNEDVLSAGVEIKW